MFLFILETIGTPELILIAIVALIILGPRKLPQMAKTVAKTVGEFKNATNEFKSTWEREIAFEDEANANVNTYSRSERLVIGENSNASKTGQSLIENKISVPEIKQLTAEEIDQNFTSKEPKPPKLQAADDKNQTSQKRNWL